ncbi:UNVERIFIED_CONTAM: hypothetical protein FKN15_036821 [Acipenser sinensis]
MQGVLSSVNIDLLPQEEVVVYGGPYLQKLESILQAYPVSTVQNYLTWQLIIDRVGSLSRRFKEARANYRKVRPEQTTQDPSKLPQDPSKLPQDPSKLPNTRAN